MDSFHLALDLCTSGTRRNFEVGSQFVLMAYAFSFYCNDPQKDVAGNAGTSTFRPGNTVSPYAFDRWGILVCVYL